MIPARREEPDDTPINFSFFRVAPRITSDLILDFRIIQQKNIHTTAHPLKLFARRNGDKKMAEFATPPRYFAYDRCLYIFFLHIFASCDRYLHILLV